MIVFGTYYCLGCSAENPYKIDAKKTRSKARIKCKKCRQSWLMDIEIFPYCENIRQEK